jgi:predicted porin
MTNMEKTLIALAVLGGCTGAAYAAGNVQLYGTIDLGIVHATGLSNGAGGTTGSTGLSSGVQSPSVIGLKGVEPLGNGMAVIFDIESGFCAAGNNQDAKLGSTTQLSGGYCVGGGFMQSRTWAAIKTRWGAIAAGRDKTRMYKNEVRFDPFAAGTTGAYTNLSIINQYGLSRLSQGIVYISPDLHGLVGSVSYSFAPGAGGTIANAAVPSARNVSRSVGANASYTSGPLAIGVAYAAVTNLRLPAMLDPATGVNDGTLSGWQVGASYDFGVATVSGLYEQAKADYTSGNAKSMLVGVRVPAGPGEVLLSFAEAKTAYGMRNINLLGTAMFGTAKQYALGYTYALSKRTNLYASYAHISNDATTNFAVGDATDAFVGTMGQGSSGVSIGLRHSF